MNIPIPLIWLAGVLQLVVVAANFVIPRKLKYSENIKDASPIIRQIFWVHSVFIVLTVFLFALLCLFFAPELAGGTSLGTFLSVFMGFFWLGRVVVQLFVYDKNVRREHRLGDVSFLAIFIYLSCLFLSRLF